VGTGASFFVEVASTEGLLALPELQAKENMAMIAIKTKLTLLLFLIFIVLFIHCRFCKVADFEQEIKQILRFIEYSH
jgi:hypothetical protein